MADATSPLSQFNGIARLFPLPNLVFFPHVVQPLHIFEPRYRQMTCDALDEDRMIAIVMPRVGWESEYVGSPRIHSVACLGRIVAEQRLVNGCFNILLKGLSRILIDHEIPQAKLYRGAKVELLAEVPIGNARIERRLRKCLVEKMPVWFPHQPAILEQFKKLLRSRLPLGALGDILCFALPLPLEFKQSLLEELEVEERLRKLITHLGNTSTAASQKPVSKWAYPPQFSVN